MNLSTAEFQLMRDYIHEACGISLGSDKEYLVRHRLDPVVREAGYSGFTEFYRHLKSGRISDGKNKVISAIVTNETSFFRNPSLFDTFRKEILPDLATEIHRRKDAPISSIQPVRILSAGASSGQEIYSVAMLIHEYLKEVRSADISARDFHLVAGDISARILAKAASGEFSTYEIEKGLPAPLKERYFLPVSGDGWGVVPQIRNMIEFRRINLMEPISGIGRFDVIFCCNVLYYFTPKAREEVIRRLSGILTPGGKLFIGATETLHPSQSGLMPKGQGTSKYYTRL